MRRAERAARPPKPPPFRDRDRTIKTCNRCNVEKPVAEFYWNQRSWSGDCRECRRIKKRGPNGKPRLPKQEPPPKAPRPTVEERFWSRVDRRGPDECWPWKSYVSKGGYGIFSYGTRADNRTTTAHRFALSTVIGPIDPALDVDHRCHDATCKRGNLCPHRRCCNPAHLAPATRTENMQNSNGGWPGAPKPHLRRTHCPYGHPYDEANTITERDGSRKCRECRRVLQRTYVNRHGQL